MSGLILFLIRFKSVERFSQNDADHFGTPENVLTEFSLVDYYRIVIHFLMKYFNNYDTLNKY